MSVFIGDNPGHLRPHSDHAAPTGDLVERLPDETSRARLRKLTDDLNDSSAIRISLFEACERARIARDEQHNLVLVYTDPWAAERAGENTLAADNPVLVRAKEELERRKKEFDRLNSRHTAVSDVTAAYRALVNRARDYLAATGEVKAFVPATKALPDDKQKLLSAIKNCRPEINTAKADRHTVLSAAFPSATAIELATKQIDDLAELGRPNVTSLIDQGPGGKINWAKIYRKHEVATISHLPDGGVAEGRGALVTDDDHATALVAFLFRDQLKAAVKAEIETLAEDGAALSLDEREKQLVQINERILNLERHEVNMIWAVGDLTQLRADVDIRALLGIDGPPEADED